MQNELIKKLIIKSAFRQRLIAAGIILFVTAFLLYGLMLAPYAAHFNSLRGQLKAQKKLLELKVGRAGSLAELNKEYLACHEKLQEVNKYFFTEAESEAFMKQLPKIVAGFGNRILLLQPRSTGRVLSISEKLAKYVVSANLPNEKELLGFIEQNKKLVDEGSGATEQLKRGLPLLPENKREEFKAIWNQIKDTGIYANLDLRQVDLEATIQGKFKGILSLFKWFDNHDKIINLNKIEINTSSQTSGVETRFTLSIYVID